VPFVTHCGVTCNPTSAERRREATYSKGEGSRRPPNPHVMSADEPVWALLHISSAGQQR
jgi:hypothetical protein